MSAQEQATGGEGLWLNAMRDMARERAFILELTEQGLFREPNGAARARGLVASIEPSAGDPQTLAVFPEGDPEPTWVDRRTMRLVEVPRTSLAVEGDVVRVADSRGPRAALARRAGAASL
ncbi:MAG: hypothetical protein QM778_05225 [Myxococcales bacterium]